MKRYNPMIKCIDDATRSILQYPGSEVNLIEDKDGKWVKHKDVEKEKDDFWNRGYEYGWEARARHDNKPICNCTDTISYENILHCPIHDKRVNTFGTDTNRLCSEIRKFRIEIKLLRETIEMKHNK